MRVDQLNPPLVFKVLIGVVEGALVDRIDGHGAVITPAVSGGACGLHADASLDLCLSAQGVGGVGAEAAGDKDADGMTDRLDLL